MVAFHHLLRVFGGGLFPQPVDPDGYPGHRYPKHVGCFWLPAFGVHIFVIKVT